MTRVVNRAVFLSSLNLENKFKLFVDIAMAGSAILIAVLVAGGALRTRANALKSSYKERDDFLGSSRYITEFDDVSIEIDLLDDKESRSRQEPRILYQVGVSLEKEGEMKEKNRVEVKATRGET